MTEVLTFESAKKQVTVTDHGVVIDTMQGRVYLSNSEMETMCNWYHGLNYGEVGPK